MGVYSRAEGNLVQSSVVVAFSEYRKIIFVDVNNITVFWVLVVSSTLKTEATDSFETFLSVRQTVYVVTSQKKMVYALKNRIRGKNIHALGLDKISVSHSQNARCVVIFSSTMSVSFEV
jgi:hypothetical protein